MEMLCTDMTVLLLAIGLDYRLPDNSFHKARGRR
jgi:hypothetical protein